MSKNIIRLTESDIHRIVKESVKRALNEGTTDSKIAGAFFDTFDEMSGHDVASILYNYLDTDAIQDVVEYLDQNGYLEGSEYEGMFDESEDEENDGHFQGFMDGMEDFDIPTLR